MGGQAIGKRKSLGQSYQGEIWEAMAPRGPKAGGRVLCVSSNLGHRCLTGASSCILAFPRITFLCSHLFLEDRGGSGTEKLRCRGLGEAATHLEAVATAVRVPSSWPCWAANRRGRLEAEPLSAGASFPAPLAHSEGNLGVTIPLVGGAFALEMIPALTESPPRLHLQIDLGAI